MTRNICLNVLAMAFVLAIAGSVSPASAIEAIQDRYCLQGETYGYPGNCQFSSYQQLGSPYLLQRKQPVYKFEKMCRT